MAPKRWFRFYVEAMHDLKLRRLTPAERWVWVGCLAIARTSPRPGVLLISEHVPADVRSVADISGVSTALARKAVAALEQGGMIERDELTVDAWRITNWAERQFEADFSRSPIPADVRARVAERCDHTCQDCGATDGLTIDHIIPVTKGGSDDEENLQILCSTCNSRKGNRIRQQRHRASRPVTPASRGGHAQITPPETETETESPLVPPKLRSVPPDSEGEVMAILKGMAEAEADRKASTLTSRSGFVKWKVAELRAEIAASGVDALTAAKRMAGIPLPAPAPLGCDECVEGWRELEDGSMAACARCRGAA